MGPSRTASNEPIIDDEVVGLLSSRTELFVRPTPWQEFRHALKPFTWEQFKENIWYNKIYLILTAPVVFVFTITKPVVDYDEEDQNWKQYLQMILCLLAPVFFVCGTNLAFIELTKDYPAWILAFTVGGIMALAVWAFSRSSQPPRWQSIFAYLGFIVSVIWIYIMANEIGNVLQTLGRMFGISDAILGLTVLAWGNSVSDFVANVAVARSGYPRMAVGACFGGPALNIMLGVGISCFVACLRRGAPYPIHDDGKHQLSVSGGFLLFSLLCSLVVISLRKFFVGRCYGIFLCVVYCAYFATSFVLEFTGKTDNSG